MKVNKKEGSPYSWRSQVGEILNQESEVWLAYLYGQRLDTISRFKRTNPAISGTFLRLLAAVYFVLRNLGLRGLPRCNGQRSAPFLVYAGTINQGRALESTVQALRREGQSVSAIAKTEVIAACQDKSVYVRYRFSLGDAFRAFQLMTARGKGVLQELKAKDHVAVNWYLNEFLRVYIYLVYFLRLLQQSNTEFVVVSNDHNVPDRCLLAVAHYLRVSTVYMQHASVTDRFPALRVSYAFLDGRAALETYKKCEANQPKTRRCAPVPEVFLTGQKKLLGTSNKKGSRVGIATNALDDLDGVIELVLAIAGSGREVSLRWHPGESARSISRYKAALQFEDSVILSDPRKEEVGGFLDGLYCLIAGNSSIHLEAALLRRQTIYYETGGIGLSDYYGYVRNGLAIQARTISEVVRTVRDIADRETEPDIDAVRYYSATYQTEWEGREGTLVAKTLLTLAKGGPKEGTFGYLEFDPTG